MDRLHDLLLQHILAGRRNARSMATVMALMAGLILLIPEFYLGPGFSWTMKLVLVGIFLALGGAFLLPALRATENHPVLALVRNRPREIVWVYVAKQTQYGAPISAQLVLGLQSGKRVTVNADLGREHELLRAVERVAPAATLGYEPAFEAQFRKQPSSLLRA
jgi:hypothetical protein